MRTNPIKKSQTSRYRITRITDDTQVNQKTTSSQEYQEVYSEMTKNDQQNKVQHMKKVEELHPLETPQGL